MSAHNTPAFTAKFDQLRNLLAHTDAKTIQAASFTHRTWPANCSADEVAALTEHVVLADWVCYPNPVDQLDWPRAAHICNICPQGFQLYYVELHGQQWPIGYSGWLPLTKGVFTTMQTAPEQLTHRSQITSDMPPSSPYYYLFNVSIIPQLHKTAQSKQLLSDHAAILPTLKAKGITAVTISDHGARVAQRYGMQYCGQMTHDGDSEAVYAALL